MSVSNYQVFRGCVSHFYEEDCDDDPTPHFQLFLRASSQTIRCSINVRSRVNPPDLVYHINHHFQHEILSRLGGLDRGFTALPQQERQGLDYLRSGLFTLTDIQSLPACESGVNNDLQAVIKKLVQDAKRTQSDVFAFGEAFGGRHPMGLHDIHMNQGNASPYALENGIFQDGGILFEQPESRHWVALFFAFQSQTTQTDEYGSPMPRAPTFADILRR